MTKRENSRFSFEYINYKGIQEVRKVKIKEFFFGKTEHHPEDQWFMKAYDYDRKAMRDFAIKDINGMEVEEPKG